MDSTANGICKTCYAGYILPCGGHEVCEGCLGHEHAVLALSPPCLCRHYAALPRQRGADTAAAAIAEWADDFTVPLDDALSLLVSSESDDSDRDEEGSPTASPLRTERPGAAALPVSAATSLPVDGTGHYCQGSRKPWPCGAHASGPPTPKDQLTAKLTDRAHQCMMQQEAVMNNIALLAHNMAADPHRLAEQAVDVAKTTRAAALRSRLPSSP